MLSMTHDIVVVGKIATRIAVMYAGEWSSRALPRRSRPRRATPTPGDWSMLDRGQLDVFRISMIWVPCLAHLETLPVLSTSGVGKPWQVQPLTVIGPPPPLPGA